MCAKRCMFGLFGVVVLLVLFGLTPSGVAQQVPEEKLAPYVPSPERIVEKMLELANVKPSDTVYDLGCGDGRIIIMAAQRFGAKAVGVELDPDLAKKTTERIKQLKLQDKVTVLQQDMLKVDLSPATVVTLYLLRSSNEKLRPNLEKYLKKGTRVVCHDYGVGGWTPERTETVPGEEGTRSHTLYLYIVGQQVQGSNQQPPAGARSLRR